jgi:hypothetical protein
MPPEPDCPATDKKCYYTVPVTEQKISVPEFERRYWKLSAQSEPKASRDVAVSGLTQTYERSGTLTVREVGDPVLIYHHGRDAL